MVPLHLVDLYNQATEDRTEQEQEEIANLLAKYSQAFSKHESDLGRKNLIEYIIDTCDSKPIKLLPRRVPMAFAGEEKKVVSEINEQGIIQISKVSTVNFTTPSALQYVYYMSELQYILDINCTSVLTTFILN